MRGYFDITNDSTSQKEPTTPSTIHYKALLSRPPLLQKEFHESTKTCEKK